MALHTHYSPATKLSDLYRRKAHVEWDLLSPYQLTLIDQCREREWDDGVVFAFLELVRREVSKRGTTFKMDLAARIGVDSTSIDHWCKIGSISAAKWEKLKHQPEFVGKYPSPEEICLHQWREHITWLRRHVQHNSRTKLIHQMPFKYAIRWDELLYVSNVHTLETDDMNVAFDECPKSWKSDFSTRKEKWSPGKLLDAMNAWGPAYRLLIMELDHDANK